MFEGEIFSFAPEHLKLLSTGRLARAKVALKEQAEQEAHARSKGWVPSAANAVAHTTQGTYTRIVKEDGVVIWEPNRAAGQTPGTRR